MYMRRRQGRGLLGGRADARRRGSCRVHTIGYNIIICIYIYIYTHIAERWNMILQPGPHINIRLYINPSVAASGRV